MTNEVVAAVTNIVEQVGGNSQAVASVWVSISVTVGSILGSLTVIAALDPTNKVANILEKVIKWFNVLDPNKPQKK